MADPDLRQAVLDVRKAIREAVEPVIMPIVNWLQWMIERVTRKDKP
jgi:hypothetical protein